MAILHNFYHLYELLYHSNLPINYLEFIENFHRLKNQAKEHLCLQILLILLNYSFNLHFCFFDLLVCLFFIGLELIVYVIWSFLIFVSFLFFF
jgi:hypothetical protein